MVGGEHRSSPLSGGRPTAILKAAIRPQHIAVVAVGIARRDQQGSIPDHLRKLVPHPVRVARIFEAGSQPFGDPKPLLDGRQQQDAGIRGEPTAVEPDMHRLTRDGWQTRQNPCTIDHGGRELPASVLKLLQQQNHTRIQRLASRPPAPS